MTMETPAVQSEKQRRRQMRYFALLWSGLTIVLGLATFVAIFVATGFLLPPSGPASAASAAEIASPAALPTQPIVFTPFPTVGVMATDAPTQSPQEIAQLATITSAPVEPTAEPTLSAMENTSFDFGIQVQESIDIEDYWMTVAHDQLHLNWVKQQVRWEDFEATRGQYDWTVLDIVVPAAASKGVTLMLSVVTSPQWAREPGADLSKHGPPADPQDYVNFVSALLNRYAEDYPGTIGAIEVWNEMNIDREWSSTQGLSTRSYVALLTATYTAVKAIDPGIIVISGALSPTGGWTEPDGRVSAIDDFQYLDGLISNGLLNTTDCVGAHHNGYNIGPRVPWDEAPRDPKAATARFRGPFDNPHHSWSLYSTLTTYANKIQLAGGEQRLCVTEFGWAVAEDLGGYPPGFEFAQDNTLQQQADYIVDAVQWMEESNVVWLAWIWNLNYGAQAGWDPNNDNTPYSILRPDNTPAPAWDAVAQYRMEHFGNQ